MAIAALGVLLIAIVVFGSASGAQSYATAQQAQATIEVAKVAQINAWGNVIIILSLLAIILALIVAVLYFRIQQGKSRKPKMIDASDQPQSLSPGRSMEMLMQMMLMEMLESRRGQRQSNLIEAPREEPEDPFPWVR